MEPLKLTLRWLLWLWLTAVILGAFFYAPRIAGFNGFDGESPESGRIFFFHVPMAVVSSIAFLVAAWWSFVYLWRRRPEADHGALAAVEVGMVYCALATITGAVWAEVQWGEAWTWDPRQTTIALALLFYGAYLTLRDTIEDPETRARIAAAYGALGAIVAPFLFFVLPRLIQSKLHNAPGSTEMGPRILTVFLAGLGAFTALFFWMYTLRRRTLALAARDELPEDEPHPTSEDPSSV